MVKTSWEESAVHVTNELKRLNDTMKDVLEKQQEILIEIAMLKVKSGVWGLLGGLIPALGILLIMLIKQL